MQNAQKRIIFLLSHPVQYYSPLFVEIANQPELDLRVLYCSNENVNGHIDKGFGVEVKWDIPLLEGYNYKFMKNNSWKPSIFNGFWGLLNFRIFSELRNCRSSYLVINGWNYASYFLAVIAAKIFGLQLCLRGESPLNQELLRPKIILLLRKIFFKYLFFKLFNYFFFIGIENKKFYEFYGVPARKLVFTPYSVDNERFAKEFEKYKNIKNELRREAGLPVNKVIILFSGKYIEKKRPMDLLKAYKELDNEESVLVFLGDGELRNKMNDFIRLNKLKNVFLIGFKNQTELGKYYSMAHIFVLPSGPGETWGLVVNEAMNFGLPIILSDMVGCSPNLLHQKINGFGFNMGDIEEIKNKLKLLVINKYLRLEMGKNSKVIIEKYDYDVTIKNILTIN